MAPARWDLAADVIANVLVCFWKDEIRARRNHELIEREWRLKQIEVAAKKAREEEMLRVARLEQVQDKEQCRSIEAGWEKAMFERVLK